MALSASGLAASARKSGRTSAGLRGRTDESVGMPPHLTPAGLPAVLELWVHDKKVGRRYGRRGAASCAVARTPRSGVSAGSWNQAAPGNRKPDSSRGGHLTMMTCTLELLTLKT